MSTQKKGRVAKPKAVKDVAVAEPVVPVVAPVAVVVPVVAPEPAPAAAPAVEAVVKPCPNIFTSTSRVKTNLNTFGINSAVYALSDPLDSNIKAYKAAKATLESGKKSDSREVDKVVDGVTTKVSEQYERAITAAESAELKKVVDQHQQHIVSMERDLHAYSQISMRFSKFAPDYVAIVCDQITRSLLTAAMLHGTSQKEPRKNIGLNELYSANLEKLPLATLFRSLKTYSETRAQFINTQRENSEKDKIAVILKEHDKSMKKRYGITRKQVEATKVPAPPAADAPKKDEPAVDEKDYTGADRRTSMEHSVHEMSKHIAKTEFPGLKLRTSGELKAHIAQLLKEFIQRLGTLLARAVKFDDSKTVKVSTVEFVIETMLIDGHSSAEVIELVNVDVPNPEILKAEELKKAAEKAAGRKYTIDLSKIPKSIGREAKHTITYPTSGYAALKESIDKILASEIDASK